MFIVLQSVSVEMLRAVFITLGITLCLGLVIGERVRYDNYQVFKVTPGNIEHLDVLRSLDGSSDSLIFLEAAEVLNKDVHVVVAPHKVADFAQVLNQNGLLNEVVEKDLQRHLNTELNIRPRAVSDYGWTKYYPLEDTYKWLRSLADEFSNIVNVAVAGKTYEGREILGVKISYGSGRKGIFIEGGIHAREWISPATVTYIINQLLTSTDPAVRTIAEKYDWYIFPHVNPDGYVYTHTTNRLWRKTRSPNGLCYGTDPNRNWDFHWNEIGASSQPCSETYAGKYAFSEIETRTLSEYIKSLKGKLNMYLSFHSYSQLLLFPYGHTRDHTPNHNDLQQIGNVAAKALARRYGTQYIVGNIYEAIYPASGASIDWAYALVDVPLTYTYELRPKNAWNGFVLPPDQIKPTGEETLDSLVAMIAEAERLGY